MPTHLPPALGLGVEIRELPKPMVTAGALLGLQLKYLLVHRNREFNTCLLRVCQLFGAQVVWHVVFGNISLEAAPATCVENCSACATMF